MIRNKGNADCGNSLRFLRLEMPLKAVKSRAGIGAGRSAGVEVPEVVK